MLSSRLGSANQAAPGLPAPSRRITPECRGVRAEMASLCFAYGSAWLLVLEECGDFLSSMKVNIGCESAKFNSASTRPASIPWVLVKKAANSVFCKQGSHDLVAVLAVPTEPRSPQAGPGFPKAGAGAMQKRKSPGAKGPLGTPPLAVSRGLRLASTASPSSTRR